MTLLFFAAMASTKSVRNRYRGQGIFMTHRLIASLATAAAAVILAACGSQSEPSTAPAAPEATTAATAAPATKAVPAQLQFTAKTLEGEDFAGESLLGKPAVLWFWAPWCPTCQREAPMVGRIAEANGDVAFVGVAALDQVPAMQEFVAKYPVKSFSHLADTDGAVWAKFGVTSQPAYAFIDANGDIDVVKGSVPEAELTERVTALTGQ
jgi:thiol-disulfide isomerase/thioredoxin